jgi:hypothetical protein
MKIETWTWAGVSCGAVLLALGTPTLVVSCSKSNPPPPPTATGGSCATDAGAFPPPNCDDTPETCTAASPACPTTPCTPFSTTSSCLAMADNTGQTVANLRIRKLNVTAPPALATHFVQTGVIDQGVNLDDFCGEPGTGSFSWLVQFNTTTNQITTGGAPPTDDPFDAGYCFVRQNIGGLPVAPITVNMTKQADGTYNSDVIPKLYVPIYVNGQVDNVIVLPLTQSKVIGVTISENNNCIGSFNPNGVGSPTGSPPTCLDQDDSLCERWFTAGSLGGFITLKEAEGVNVEELGKSLCVLLTGGVDTVNGGKDCPTDANGNVTGVTGNFCSTTDSPGGCADSYWLAATFAASAAKISAGTDVPQCNGSLEDGGASEAGTTPEAGTDTGTTTPSDAGPG